MVPASIPTHRLRDVASCYYAKGSKRNRPGSAWALACQLETNWRLPWMMKTALDYLLEDGDYEKNPTGGPAVAARILAAMLTSLEKVDGLNWEAS